MAIYLVAPQFTMKGKMIKQLIKTDPNRNPNTSTDGALTMSWHLHWKKVTLILTITEIVSQFLRKYLSIHVIVYVHVILHEEHYGLLNRNRKAPTWNLVELLTQHTRKGWLVGVRDGTCWMKRWNWISSYR